MRKILFLCAISIMVLTGCSQMEGPSISNEKSTTGDSHFVDLETALDNVDFVLRDLGIESTRSGLSMIKDVEYVMKPSTRSDENNTDAPKYYLVNFKDDKGFVMLSADDRLPELMAFSDSGSISLSDTTFNPLLKIYIEMPIDTTIVRPDPRPDTPKTEYVCEPLIAQTVSRWGQEEPFNKIFVLNGYLKTGCTPVACGIYMAKFKYPTSYAGIQFPWNDMYNTPGHEKISYLLYEIAKRLPIDNNSGARPVDIIPTMNSFGYSNFTSAGMNRSLIKEVLKGNKSKDKQPIPLIASGKNVNDTYGHTWIIDGLYTIKFGMPIILDAPDGIYDMAFYPHCVWGWDGNGNGYYLYLTEIGGNADKKDVFDLQNPYTTTIFNERLEVFYGTPDNL